MPYIPAEQRESIAEYGYIADPGALNYAITQLCVEYANEHPRYQGINDVLGALEGAKLEFYRRFAAPYEDGKLKLNGDVY